jgi:hypothetical protein
LSFTFTSPVRELKMSWHGTRSLGPRTERNDRTTTGFLLLDLVPRHHCY